MTQPSSILRTATRVLVAALVFQLMEAPLFAQSRRPQPSRQRGSISAENRTTRTRSGNTTTAERPRGTGTRTVEQSGDDFTVNRDVETQRGASGAVTRQIETDDGRVESVERTSEATNRFGETLEREREVERRNGYVEFESQAQTSTGREIEAEGVAGRNIYGRPAVAGTADTRYYGDVAYGAVRGPSGARGVVAGPYGGTVYTQLPSGYRTMTYYGRPYYAHGGVYYRPYVYGGVPYYYPIPPPYYVSYSSIPVGAVVIVVAGMTYAVSQGTYYKETTNSQGQPSYETVPAPTGAALQTLPPERVLVTLGGTAYYVYANTFYRRIIVDGDSERFVTVTAPQGAVFIPALPPDFEVVQLNTMYFAQDANYYIPFLDAGGDELYLLVDVPPQPPAGATDATTPPAPQATQGTAPAPTELTERADEVPAVEALTVPEGTVLPVRLATNLSSASAQPGDRFKAYLDEDLIVSGRIVAGRGATAYGRIISVDAASQMSGRPTIAVELTDLQVGAQVVAIQTQAVSAEGEEARGARRLLGGVGIGAAIGAIAGGGDGAAIGAAIGAGAGGAAAAASSTPEAAFAAESLLPFALAVPVDVG